MFGYVRPLKGELKVREFEQFKAEYCGLCRVLRREYGFAASMTLNYDLTVLAMLLAEGEGGYEHCRCAASPFKKKCVCTADGGLNTAADVSVLLAWYKLRDDVADGGFFGALKARFESLFLRRAFKKAKKRRPETDALVAKQLKKLEEIETERPDSIDRPADCFAGILSALAPEGNMALGQLLYHLGRWIYLVDAWDDLQKDFKSGAYNPLILRFDLAAPKLEGEAEKTLSTTLAHSENLMRSAFELLPRSRFTCELENILYLGLPAVASEVRQGTWQKKRDRRPE